jgi:threonine synthase
VPSGNFGNLTAGLIAKRMGLPVNFIVGTNINDVFPKYLVSGEFKPVPSKRTISNAMDVGNPSNFQRIMDLYDNSLGRIKKDITAFSVTDEETKYTMKKVWKEKKYMLDPHGAVAYSALIRCGLVNQNNSGVILETAHPAKFKDVVEQTLGKNVSIPESLAACMKKEKSAISMTADFNSLKDFLMEKFS